MPVQSDNLATEVHALVDSLRNLELSCLKSQPIDSKQTVESQHGGTAYFVQSVSVHEKHAGETVWDGAVAIFDLWDSPSGATRAYAWSYEPPDGPRRFCGPAPASYYWLRWPRFVRQDLRLLR